MAVSVQDRELGGLRWITLHGPRDELFLTLGATAADEVHAVLDNLPEAQELRRFAASSGGGELFDAVLAATNDRYPQELQEALDLAAGARYDADALLLANLRGDLGGDVHLGCTDLARVGERTIMAHNEDGAPALAGRLMLVTLAVDHEVPVTVQWYPGFLPGNTFVATGHGLVWGIDHLPVPVPTVAPGRQFVARAVQHQTTLDAAVRFLEEHPTAGGFAYTIGALGDGRVVSVEAAAGQVATVEASVQEPGSLWHTNHVRYLAGSAPDAAGSLIATSRGVSYLGELEESRERGRIAEGLVSAAADVGAEWFLEVMAEQHAPTGVLRSAEGGDPLMTLCTTVVDLAAGEITFQPRGQGPVTLPAAAYVAGTM